MRRRIGSLRQKTNRPKPRYCVSTKAMNPTPGIYGQRGGGKDLRDFRALIARTEKEKQRLESIIEQQVTSQNTIEMVRRSLEEVRDVNLDNASFGDKQELIAKLGIIVYPLEDHKTVRITTKLPILQDEFSHQIMSIASPKL